MSLSQNLKVLIAADAAKLITAVDLAERKLVGLGRVSEETSAKMVASDAKTAASAEKTGGALASIHKHALAGGVAVAGLFGGYEAAKSAVSSTIELGKQTAFLSSTTGTSVKQSSQLAAVMQSLGIESAGTAMSIKALSKQTELQIAGTSKQATAFDKLGISQADASAHSHDMVGLLELVANRLQKVQGGTEKTTILTALFGKSYQNINPLIRDGGKALAEQIALADKYGVTLTSKTLPKILEMAQAEREHKTAMLGLKVAFTEVAGKPMIDFEHRLASILNDIRAGNFVDLSKQTTALGDGLSKVITAITPKLADAFAQAAPKMVLGLIHGFTQASVGGEILIGALLVKKFGLISAFGTAGLNAAKAFGIKFAAIAAPAAAAEGTATGAEFGAAFDAAAAASVGGAGAVAGGELVAGGALAASVAKLGSAIGKTLAKGSAITFGAWLGSKLENLLPGEGGLSAAPGESTSSTPQTGGLGPGFMPAGPYGAGTGKFSHFVTSGLQYEGLDQGVDFTGSGSLRAPANIKITNVNRHSGWPGGTLIAGQITSGPNKGRYVYFAEALTPGSGVAVGKTISAGSEIASLNSSYPGSESGFAQDASGRAYGNIHEGKGGNAPDPQAVAFANFLAGTTSSAGPSGGHPTGGPSGGSSGSFRTVGASMYGGPTDKASGHMGYKGDNLDTGPLAFAELGMGHNLGGLAHGAALVITYRGRSVTAYKLDIGAGGGNVKGHRRDIDLYYRTAAALGFPNGLDLVQIRQSGGQAAGTKAQTLAQTQSADFSNYQTALSDVSLQGQAGILTPGQVAAQSRAIGQSALKGGYGSLDAHMILQVQADIYGASTGSAELKKIESAAEKRVLGAGHNIGTKQSLLVSQFSTQIAAFIAKQTHTEQLQSILPNDLSTPAGEARALANLHEQKAAKSHVKDLYTQEVAAIRKEIAAWTKSRDVYRKLARKAKGSAKTEALKRAAGMQANIDQGVADAATLGQNISDTVVALDSLDQQITQTTADAAQQQADAHTAAVAQDFGNYQQANSDIDLQVAAGLMTQAQGDALKTQNAQKALAGGFGELNKRDQWQVMADLKNATTNLTTAIDANTQAQLDANKLQADYLRAALATAGVEMGVVYKALADIISGQIVGVDYSGRVQTAGTGTAARYRTLRASPPGPREHSIRRRPSPPVT